MTVPHHHHNRFMALFPGPPGKVVPEKNFWTLWCKGRLTGRHIDHPAGHHSIRTNQCPPPPSPTFLQARSPSRRPTNSDTKHWRQLAHSDTNAYCTSKTTELTVFSMNKPTKRSRRQHTCESIVSWIITSYQAAQSRAATGYIRVSIGYLGSVGRQKITRVIGNFFLPDTTRVPKFEKSPHMSMQHFFH